MQDRRYTVWTSDEDNLLQEMWGNSSPDKIARKLGRTTLAVVQRVKAKNLGSFTEVGVYINRNQAAQMVGVDYKVLSRNWEQNHNLRFIKKKIRTDTKSQYLISLDDFIEWLKNHQELWDSRKTELYALGYEPEWLVEKRKRDKEQTNKPRGTKFTPREDALIVMYLKMNKSQREIGRILNRSKSSINARIMRLDVWGTGKLKEGWKREKVGAVQ